MPRVINSNEVMLYGERYPIKGTVRDQLINPFPGKITIGDYSRADQEVASEWAITDWGGGLGIENGDFPQTQDRFNFSTLETRFPRQLSLTPLATRYSTLGPADFMFDYGGTFYVVVSDLIYSWDEDTSTFTLAHTLQDPATDWAIFLGDLYVAVGSGADIETYDGTTWATVASEKAAKLIVWNDSLYALTNAGAMKYSATGATTSFTAAGTLDLPLDSAKQLIVYFDNAGAPVIFVITDRGAFAYDLATETFVATPMTYPIHPNVGLAAVWRGDLYIPVGPSIYKYNGQTIQVVGPDKDEGLPADYRGEIVCIVGTHPFYYAVVNAVNPGSGTSALDMIYTGSHSNTTFFSPTASRGLVLSSSGVSWHTSWQEPEAGASMGVAAVSNVQDTYRFWFSTGNGLYSFPIPTAVHNPLRNPTQEFQQEGYLLTSWFDAGWAELDKLGLQVEVSATGLSSTETYSLWVQWDAAESAWEFVGESDGVTRNAKFPLELQTSGGVIFRKVRFKLELERGSTTTKTPVIGDISLAFMRVPPPAWGYQFTLDFTQPYNRKTPRQMKETLKAAIRNRKVGTFIYHEEDAEDDHEVLVTFSRQSGAQQTGLNHSGLWTISVIEVLPESVYAE